MFEPAPKTRLAGLVRAPVQRVFKRTSLTRTAAPKPIATKLERRRKKNKREKPSRRRTRTMSLYGDGNALRSLIMLMYADA